MVLLPFPRFLLFENDWLDVLLSSKKRMSSILRRIIEKSIHDFRLGLGIKNTIFKNSISPNLTFRQAALNQLDRLLID